MKQFEIGDNTFDVTIYTDQMQNKTDHLSKIEGNVFHPNDQGDTSSSPHHYSSNWICGQCVSGAPKGITK